MKIDNLKLTNYRNYKKVDLSLSPKINIFIGNNATGKTNILEAIYSLALVKSYKAKDEEVIKRGEEFYKIEAFASSNSDNLNLIMIGTPNGKRLIKNGIDIKKVSDFIGLINVVLFSPDDIVSLKNSPQDRRNIIDLSLLQISKKYVDNYSLYKKQLKLRNDHLKYLQSKVNDEEIEDEMLEILTANLIETNKTITDMRRDYIKRLESLASTKYKELSGEDVNIRIEYITNSETNIDAYKKRYRQDIIGGSTSIGCHRDDIKFYKNGFDFISSASQGELRMLALSLKLSFAEIIKKKKDEYPIVLLDDVLSELDSNHQNRLLNMLDRSMQIILTSTDINKLSDLALKGSKVYTIFNQEIKETYINGRREENTR